MVKERSVHRVQLIAKKVKKTPERRRKIKLIHSEYRQLLTVVLTTLKSTSGFRADSQSPKDMRHELIPIYKYFATHINDIFATGPVLYDQLSEFKIDGFNPIAGEIKISYIFLSGGIKVIHRLIFQHEQYPFQDHGTPEMWDAV